MIYVTLGTQPCDFSRCMKMIEELVIDYNIDEPIIAQIGHTSYIPTIQNIETFKFVPEQEYQNYISSANIIISHAGTGALFSSIKKGKTIIAVARLKEFGEMVNNHQTEIISKLSKEGYVIDGTYSIKNAWKIALSFSPPQNDFYNYLPEAIDSQIKEWLK